MAVEAVIQVTDGLAAPDPPPRVEPGNEQAGALGDDREGLIEEEVVGVFLFLREGRSFQYLGTLQEGDQREEQLLAMAQLQVAGPARPAWMTKFSPGCPRQA